MALSHTPTATSRMSKRLDQAEIVVVDDDPDVRQAVSLAFAAEGASVRTASDGHEAVRVCHERTPQLVVLDMMLPGRSGYLVLEKIKGNPESPAVIMLTANEGKRHMAYALSLGVDEFIVKPAPLEDLILSAARLIQARRTESGA